MKSRVVCSLVVFANVIFGVACDDSPPESQEFCTNGVDDDGDGATDCDDSDCFTAPNCDVRNENCTNGDDDDGDGATDCDDSDCDSDPTCSGSHENCTNGVDDDDDGNTDCDDSDCDDDPTCAGPVENCINGVDDDDDSDIDCDDSDCDDDPACAGPDENCTNGVDDDDDGDIDCLDSDCEGTADCLEVCDDGLDNDLDGGIDCADSDCDGDPNCLEECTNHIDDDGDELIDCMDPSCDFYLACAELCNGIDDDGDGRIDEFPIDPTIGEPCYDGPPEAAGIGTCTRGVAECFGGGLQCMGWVAPLEDELCDGLDNDCDGLVPDEEADEDCGTTVSPGEVTNLEFETEIRDVDVHINLDTTGSMGEELDALRASISTSIVPEIRTVLPTAAFGVSTFDDFPFGTFGSDWLGDQPYVLHQRVTSNVSAVQEAIDAIELHGGGDGPESGIESLYQIATGEGVFWDGGWGEEDCSTETSDEDGDGLVNCDDLDCVSFIECLQYPSEECTNDVDDDGDGYVDCNDPNCIFDAWWDCWELLAGACGNGEMNEGEECDDGNTVAGDGCDESCAIENGCGNAYMGASEQCDDGNSFDGDGCSSTCEIEPGNCGNGDIEYFEQCDDGGTDGGDGCDPTCMLEANCGDGAVAPGEECDDGNVDEGDGCTSTCELGLFGAPAFDWADGFDAGQGHGSVGGVGFRDTALPIIVHITDNVSHDGSDYTDAGYDVNSHLATNTFDALTGIGTRIIGVRTGLAAMSIDPDDWLSPLGMTMATDTVVAVCAFDGSAARTSGVCGDGECCTGVGGAGVAPISGDMCPMVFDVLDDGTGLSESVITGIEALSRFATYELTVASRDDESDAIDATCFIEGLSISGYSMPSGDCAIAPVGLDTDGDGDVDTLQNATPRTRVTFEIAAVNEDVNDVDGDGDRTESCAEPGTYWLFLDVIADGRTRVATRRVEVVVP